MSQNDYVELLRNVEEALWIAWQYGCIDGHHKMWVIDQMVRALTADSYKDWVKKYDGREYEWQTGIAP